MLNQALNIVSKRVCGRCNQAAACRITLTGAGRERSRSGQARRMANLCWPHLRRKQRGEACYSKKHPLLTHPHFDELPKHLEAVHLSQSAEMRCANTSYLCKIQILAKSGICGGRTGTCALNGTSIWSHRGIIGALVSLTACRARRHSKHISVQAQQANNATRILGMF